MPHFFEAFTQSRAKSRGKIHREIFEMNSSLIRIRIVCVFLHPLPPVWILFVFADFRQTSRTPQIQNLAGGKGAKWNFWGTRRQISASKHERGAIFYQLFYGAGSRAAP